MEYSDAMNRRSSIKFLALGGIIATAGAGHHWLTRPREHPELAIDAALQRLNQLDIDAIDSSGEWGVARTLDHLAQSIEFSMLGYPEMKSKTFQNTLGQLAFSVFQARGRMTHGLNEIIPGEVVTTATPNSANARARLIQALEQFDTFNGTLKPHFAYGQLDKAQYTAAHVMHINNHWLEFETT